MLHIKPLSYLLTSRSFVPFCWEKLCRGTDSTALSPSIRTVNLMCKAHVMLVNSSAALPYIKHDQTKGLRLDLETEQHWMNQNGLYLSSIDSTRFAPRIRYRFRVGTEENFVHFSH